MKWQEKGSPQGCRPFPVPFLGLSALNCIPGLLLCSALRCRRRLELGEAEATAAPGVVKLPASVVSPRPWAHFSLQPGRGGGFLLLLISGAPLCLAWLSATPLPVIASSLH